MNTQCEADARPSTLQVVPERLTAAWGLAGELSSPPRKGVIHRPSAGSLLEAQGLRAPCSAGNGSGCGADPELVCVPRARQQKVARLALTSTTADRSLTRFLGSTPLMCIDRGAEHLDSGDESCV
jgi:hypothetical protein